MTIHHQYSYEWVHEYVWMDWISCLYQVHHILIHRRDRVYISHCEDFEALKVEQLHVCVRLPNNETTTGSNCPRITCCYKDVIKNQEPLERLYTRPISFRYRLGFNHDHVFPSLLSYLLRYSNNHICWIQGYVESLFKFLFYLIKIS